MSRSEIYSHIELEIDKMTDGGLVRPSELS